MVIKIMAKKPIMGDMLDSIFDDGYDDFGSGADMLSPALQTMKIGALEPNRSQPRRDFDKDKLDVLADSIRQHGVIQPITVRQLSDGDAYQIVAGERRWRAARIAGIEEVPVRVMELTDQQTMQIALIENLQREDLNPVDEANGYAELMEKYGMTQDQVSGIVGKARSSVANALRLLTLPDEVLEMLRNNTLSKGHCKAIMAAQSTAAMVKLAKQAAAGELSVRETERLARQSNDADGSSVKAAKPVVRKNVFFQETELALGLALKTAVRIVDGKQKKTLCIDFNNEEELKEILRNFKY